MEAYTIFILKTVIAHYDRRTLNFPESFNLLNTIMVYYGV